MRDESYENFLSLLKAAGIAITNETELRERLAQARRWQYAFMTLAANGDSLGIRFSESGTGSDKTTVCNTFANYRFPAQSDSVFVSKLQAQY